MHATQLASTRMHMRGPSWNPATCAMTAPLPCTALHCALHAGGRWQVAAGACLMECVRSEGGPGTYALELYGRLLRGALCGAGTRPEVLALMVTKYLAMADVRCAVCGGQLGRAGGGRW